MTLPRIGVITLIALTLVIAGLEIQLATGNCLRRLATESTLAIADESNMSIPRRLEEAPICYIENDFDYEDNDIGSKSGLPVSQCCWECHRKSGCKAWSWNNYNGGTCWFKSKRGTILHKPGVQSAIKYYTPQDVCNLEANTNYDSDNIGYERSDTAEGCCDKCRNFSG